jgi:hypothetical protein
MLVFMYCGWCCVICLAVRCFIWENIVIECQMGTVILKNLLTSLKKIEKTVVFKLQICRVITEIFDENTLNISAIMFSKLPTFQFVIRNYTNLVVVNLFLRYLCCVRAPCESFNRAVKFKLTELIIIFLNGALRVHSQLTTF